MNHVISGLNFLGVLALAFLCAAQWRTNREMNLQVNALDQTRIANEAKIAEQETAIKGYASDMEELRSRLQTTEASLKEETDKTAKLTLDNQRLTDERDQLSTERDQLRESLKSWEAAVAARDEAIKKSDAEIQKLAGERNDAVVKFNQLATKYNDIVKQLNAERALRRPATTQAATSPP